MPLWFQTTQIARPNYYDRNPATNITTVAVGGITPHGSTVRASYTVPADKKAYLDSLWASMIRDGVTGSPGSTVMLIGYVPIGGSVGYLMQLFMNNGTLWTQVSDVVPAFGYMGPGDHFNVSTTDASSGGTFQFNAGVKRTEFDI